MSYKIISMDFDGTLLTSNKNVSKKNKEVLLKCKKDNCIIVGITARNLSSVKSVCDIDLFNYLILNNGAYIYDVKREDSLELCYIDENDIIEITNYFKDFAEEIDYCSLNKYYFYKKGDIVDKGFIEKINSIDEIKETIVRMNIFFRNVLDIEKYRKFISDNFKDINVFEMFDSDQKDKNYKWLSLNSKYTDKYKGLEKLCSMLNLKIEEVIFFGDGPNDLPIIDKVGLGVAMGNALEEVKLKAKQIALSNDEDGIAVFLENIFYKN